MPRAQRPVGRTVKDGRPVILYSSVEDPESPNVIHHRLVRADEFVEANAEAGFNERQICWAIIAFLFAYWNEEIRPRIAQARGVEPNDIRVGIFGDLRILRHSILHENGTLGVVAHAKLTVMGALCRPEAVLAFSHAEMKRLFELIHQGIAQLVLEHTGHLVGAPRPEEVLKVAIQSIARK
jgi:hypothetical protein